MRAFIWHNRKLKIILLALAGLVGALALLYGAMWVIVYWALAGIWPFSPLEHVTEQLGLENGGKILIEGQEERGFGSDGFMFEASYLPPNSQTPELVGGWVGPQATPAVYVLNDLVILLNPDRKRLHVRTRAGNWKWFLMDFPDRSAAFPLSHYTALTSLSEEALESILAEQGGAENGYSPNLYIEGFDPEQREVIITYYPRPGITSRLFLGLADDGSYLSLKRIER